MSDVFVALAEALPKPGDIFPIEDRIRWLRALGAVADYIFHTDNSLRIEADTPSADVVPAPEFHRTAAGAEPALVNLHTRTGTVEVDWAEAERLLKDGTEAQRLQAMLLIGLRDDKFFTMGEPAVPPAAPADPSVEPKPPQQPLEAPIVAENPQDLALHPIETPIEGATKRVRLREMWARQIPIDQIATALDWEKATVLGTARKIGLPARKGGVGNCGCGRLATHNGRCAFRRGLAGPPGTDVRARTGDPQPPPEPVDPEPAVPDMPTHATVVDGAIVHGDAPLTPADRAAVSGVIGAAHRQLRDNGFRARLPPAPPRGSPTPERRSVDQTQIDAAIAAGKMQRIPAPGEPGFSGIGQLIRDPDTKKEKRVATPNIDQIAIVLQYLRTERDTVVGATQDGTYMVNGVGMKLDEVLARANRMRVRAGKEPFRLEA